MKKMLKPIIVMVVLTLSFSTASIGVYADSSKNVDPTVGFIELELK